MDLPRFPFRTALRRLNAPALAAFDRFLLPPGARFGDRGQWWGGGSPRRRPHEGVDLRWYRERGGQDRRLEPSTRVPALAAGRVVRIAEDFLGHSVFVVHEARDAGRVLLAVYGHVEPALETGDEVPEGGLLALIAPPRSGRVPPHLHLSTLRLPEDFPIEALDWPLLHASPEASFCDPLPLLACPWEQIPDSDRLHEQGTGASH